MLSQRPSFHHYLNVPEHTTFQDARHPCSSPYRKKGGHVILQPPANLYMWKNLAILPQPYPMSYSRIFRYSVLRLMPSAVAASERLLS